MIWGDKTNQKYFKKVKPEVLALDFNSSLKGQAFSDRASSTDILRKHAAGH